MHSTETIFSATQQQQLLQLARDSIIHGLQHGRALPVSVFTYPDALRIPYASFVTLHKHDALRGCIGSLEAHRPLVEDIAENAYAAAFRDPRFDTLQKDEFAQLEIHISVLHQPQQITFIDEADLLSQLRPGVDGLILESPGHRGTFLPSVWESLPEPEDFIRHLKRKAGLAEDYWSDDIDVRRYSSESF